MPDLQHYQGREQGFVKHSLMEKYLERFAIKISSKWDEIVYIDAFAGPWKTQAEDFADTSFHIALKCLKSGAGVARDRFQRTIRVRAFLIEKNTLAFQKLSEFGDSQREQGFEVTCLPGEFEEKAQDISTFLQQAELQRSFIFALIDPKGWSGLSMEVIAPLVQRRSAEVLVNVMSSFIHRFVDVENCHDSYERFFGRPGVRDIIRNTAREDRQDAVVREYCRSLRRQCDFKFVSSCVILEPDKRGVKYFLVFATNDPMGIKVFKEAEAHAASIQDDLKDARTHRGQAMLDLGMDSPASASLREKYRKEAFQRTEDQLKEHRTLSYVDVFCKAMAMPLVTEAELLNFLSSHPNIELRLDGKKRKKPDIKSSKDKVKWRAASADRSNSDLF